MERITISGKVQNVGLRIKIANIADKLGVCGRVENLANGTVLMVCKGEQEVLDEMMHQIKQIPSPVTIESMAIVETSPATGMSGFQILSHDSGEEWKVAIKAGMGILDKISGTQVSIDKRQEEISETQKDIKGTLVEISETQGDIRDTLTSINDKMSKSLNNDAQILDILGSMRAGGMLRITE